MTRRTFLVLTGGFALLTAGAAIVQQYGWTRVRDGLKTLEGFGNKPVDRLRQHYAWLDIDAAAFTRYVADYEAAFGQVTRVSRLRPEFFVRFLLSTNFFPQRADPGGLRYTVFYDPTARSCGNPIAGRPPTDAELS